MKRLHLNYRTSDFIQTQKSQLFSTSNENQGNDVVTVEPRFNEEPRD